MKQLENSTQKHLNEGRITIDEAKKLGIKVIDIDPKTCEFCGKKLRPTGLVIEFLGTYRWLHNDKDFEECDCPRAVEHREYLKKLEEEKIRAEKEKAYQQKIEEMIKKSRLGDRFKKRTFENFVVNEKNRQAYEMAKKYAENFAKYKEQGLGLAFTGSYGTGKTHLAAAICHEIIKQGYQPIFGTMINLLGEIKATYDEWAKEDEIRVLDRYTNCHLLVIDDLGKEKPTEWSLEKLYYIVNTRYEKSLPIVITSNYDANKLTERLVAKDNPKNVETAEAIVSRLFEMCVGIEMNWEDYRKEGLL